MTRRMTASLLFSATMAAAMIVLSTHQAAAVPYFAKKHAVECDECHIAYPTLNHVGRTYKKDGYRLHGATEKTPRVFDADLTLNNEFPFSTRILGRPYDHVAQDQNWKLNALHEIELLIPANPHPQMSAWLDIEAADDTDWTPEIAEGMVGLHPHPMFNVQAGYADIFFSDPYDTLTTGGRRMTVARKKPLDYTVGFNTRRLDDPAQQINVNGQIGPVYYLAGAVTNNGGLDGNEKDKDAFGRLAVDVLDGTAIGAFYFRGRDLIDTDPTLAVNLVENRFRRVGLDLRHDCDLTGATLLALNVWSRDEDPNGTGTPVDLVTGYVEVLRPFKAGGHLVVPLLRYNWGSSDDDQALAESLRATTLQVSTYIYENLKVQAEYTAEQAGQSNNNDNRLTMQFDVVF